MLRRRGRRRRIHDDGVGDVVFGQVVAEGRKVGRLPLRFQCTRPRRGVEPDVGQHHAGGCSDAEEADVDVKLGPQRFRLVGELREEGAPDEAGADDRDGEGELGQVEAAVDLRVDGERGGEEGRTPARRPPPRLPLPSLLLFSPPAARASRPSGR